MEEWKTYYRAFLEYKKKTAADKNVRKLCEAIEKASSDEDSLEAVRSFCIIEEDWIQIIEEGMEHVEKAIREERQFIRKQGEVVPIEKLKRTSTETVRHLAKHSELITEAPEEDETLTPEKLYMSENLSDFAVYENRFLYMLLCYLRDFIGARLDKILELGRTYRMQTRIQKNVRIGKKSMQYKTTLLYEDKDDPLSDEYFESSPLIGRIETMQRLVTSLLMTPLMKEVSKAPMVTPPITRTNVLRMNVHFKAALEMYGKISAYTKPGYELKEIKNSYRPLPDALLSEVAEVIALHQFLSYKYGNKLSERLRAEYETEEAKKKELQKDAQKAKLEELKQRIEQGGGSKEEYIFALEERVKQLEKDGVDLRVAKKQIESLNEKIDEQQQDIDSLKNKTDELRATIAEKDKEAKDTEAKFVLEKAAQEKAHAAALAEQEAKLATDKKNFLAELKVKEDACEKAKAESEEKCKRYADEKMLVQAQLHGLRQQCGLITPEEDFTSKERFMELEKEFAAFEKLFKTQWGFTKKRIRKEILGKKPERLYPKSLEEAEGLTGRLEKPEKADLEEPAVTMEAAVSEDKAKENEETSSAT